MRSKIAITAIAALVSAGLAPAAGAGATEPTTTLVSRDSNGSSLWCDVSSGGWAVAFMSTASNLVWRDTNDQFDVFLASEGEIERVSVTSREKQAATYSLAPTISDDGTRVAFKVSGYRLTEEGRRGHAFVRDTTSGLTERVTVAADGGRPGAGSTGTPKISGNGRHVAFHSHAKNLTDERERDDNADAFVRNLARDETEKVSIALDGGRPNRWSGEPVLSQDGRFVAFISRATDLVRGDDDNHAMDVFRYDRKTRQTIRVSIASDGTASEMHSFRPAISADGRYVAFETYSALASDDANGQLDVYVHDVFTGTTELVSRGPAGPGNTPSEAASISADGRYVAFTSQASNLVPGDTNSTPPLSHGYDVFVRDRVEQETTMVSRGHEGQQGNRDSGGGSISPDGNYVCWNSESDNLVPGDENESMDVFLRGPLWAGEE